MESQDFYPHNEVMTLQHDSTALTKTRTLAYEPPVIEMIQLSLHTTYLHHLYSRALS